MNEYQEKLSSLGFSTRRGQDRVKPVKNDDDGTNAGVEVEHWNDSQDAYARPKTLHFKWGQRSES